MRRFHMFFDAQDWTAVTAIIGRGSVAELVRQLVKEWIERERAGLRSGGA